MTGRELIIYILENNLEDKQIFENGELVGFITVEQAAVKFEVGRATIKAWLETGLLSGIRIGDEIYIPVNSKDPIKGGNNV